MAEGTHHQIEGYFSQNVHILLDELLEVDPEKRAPIKKIVVNLAVLSTINQLGTAFGDYSVYSEHMGATLARCFEFAWNNDKKLESYQDVMCAFNPEERIWIGH